MLDKAAEINKLINSFIEGVPAMVCIIGAGLLLSFCFLHCCVNLHTLIFHSQLRQHLLKHILRLNSQT